MWEDPPRVKTFLYAVAAFAAVGGIGCARFVVKPLTPRRGERTIVLLDLNYTFVKNQEGSRRAGRGDFAKRIEQERYRGWLKDFIRDTYVIMITARPEKHKKQSLANIKKQMHWMPDEAYFNEKDLSPPECKKDILERYVFPKHGGPGGGPHYVAIESNPKTAAMYDSLGIPALRVWDGGYRSE